MKQMGIPAGRLPGDKRKWLASRGLALLLAAGLTLGQAPAAEAGAPEGFAGFSAGFVPPAAAPAAETAESAAAAGDAEAAGLDTSVDSADGSGDAAPAEGAAEVVPGDSAEGAADISAVPVENAAGISAVPANGTSGSVPVPAGNTVPAAATELKDPSAVIPEGVSVLGIALGGMTAADAAAQINAYYDNLASSTLTVTFDEQSASATLRELGMSWDAAGPAQEAAELGRDGSVITRYMALADIRADGADIPTACSFDMSAVDYFVRTAIASHDALPQDAVLIRNENREFVVTPDVHGMVTNVENTVSRIMEELYGSLDGGDLTVEADVEIAIPAVTTEMLSAVGDKLGTYHTDYSSSSSARKTNIRVAAERIDGTILMPGESFSLSETILSRTPENGYEMAPQYVNGDTELSYGGGVCQVSTTLYNAVIRAELEVTERHPHSMVVNYVPYSSDAAISEGNKDLQFRNSLDYPVYLAADADGEGLYFSVYGKETRPESRTIEFVSDTLSYKESKTKVVEDSSMKAGEERSKGSNHPEVSSTLTKVIYENGTETGREVLNKDYYSGSSKTIYRGTKKSEKKSSSDSDSGSSEKKKKKASEPEELELEELEIEEIG